MLRLDSCVALDAWLEDRLDRDIQEQLGPLPSPPSTPWAEPVATGLDLSILPTQSLSPGPYSPRLGNAAAVDAVACPVVGMPPASLPSSGAGMWLCGMTGDNTSHMSIPQRPTHAHTCSGTCLCGQTLGQLTASCGPSWELLQGPLATSADPPMRLTPPPGYQACEDMCSAPACPMSPSSGRAGADRKGLIQGPSREACLLAGQWYQQPSSTQQGMAAQVLVQDMQANARPHYALDSTKQTATTAVAAADGATEPQGVPEPSGPNSQQRNRAGKVQNGGRRTRRGCRVPQALSSSARYHASRRAGLAALQAAVASKAAQVADLEAARGALAQRAHVLETMVANADKLLALLAARAPQGKVGPTSQAEQAVDLLTLGVARSPQVPRPLHLMLEAGMALHPLSWPLHELLQRWRGYVGALRPLLGRVAEAQAALPPPPAVPQEGRLRRGPRRAAAAAASRIASLAQQLDEQAAHTEDEAGDGVVLAALATPRLRQGGGTYKRADHGNPCSCCWPPAGEVDGRLVYGGPGTQGVPLEVLAQVEALVLDNMAWLHVLATSTALHKHHFFAADFEGRDRLPPSRSDPFWQLVVAAMQLTPAQRQECATSLEAAKRCCAVMCADRQDLQEQLTAAAATCPTSCCDVLVRCAALEAAAAAAEGMERSLAREHVTRHLVGMAQSNVFSLLQQARAAVAAWPWFPGPWSVFEAAAAGLQEQEQQLSV